MVQVKNGKFNDEKYAMLLNETFVFATLQQLVFILKTQFRMKKMSRARNCIAGMYLPENGFLRFQICRKAGFFFGKNSIGKCPGRIPVHIRITAVTSPSVGVSGLLLLLRYEIPRGYLVQLSVHITWVGVIQLQRRKLTLRVFNIYILYVARTLP